MLDTSSQKVIIQNSKITTKEIIFSDINNSELLIEATRAYAASHLAEALANELAIHQIAELKGKKVFELP